MEARYSPIAKQKIDAWLSTYHRFYLGKGAPLPQTSASDRYQVSLLGCQDRLQDLRSPEKYRLLIVGGMNDSIWWLSSHGQNLD